MVTKKLITGRIIPAYAGSTVQRYLAGWRRADHPRLGGERTTNVPRAQIGGQGSSPHTRGARSGSIFRDIRNRIIPAYAGSTRHSGVFAL